MMRAEEERGGLVDRLKAIVTEIGKYGLIRVLEAVEPASESSSGEGA